LFLRFSTVRWSEVLSTELVFADDLEYFYCNKANNLVLDF
jgi:hypothetical protein